MEILPCKDFNVDELRFDKFDPENGDSNDNFYIIKPHYKNPLVETGELPLCSFNRHDFKRGISIPYIHDTLVCQELFDTLLKIDDKIRNRKEEIFGKYHKQMMYVPIVKNNYNDLDELSDDEDIPDYQMINYHKHKDYKKCRMKFCLDSEGKTIKTYQFVRNRWTEVITKVDSYSPGMSGVSTHHALYFGKSNVRVIFKVGPILVSKRKENSRRYVFINLKIVQIETIRNNVSLHEYMFEPEQEFVWHMPKKYYFEPPELNITHELYNTVQQTNGCNKYFQELLETDGFNKHFTDIIGRTLLHMAIKYGNHQKAKILLDHYVDVNAVDDEGYTPLHYACSGNREECIKLLLQYNADMNIRDNNNKRPHCFTRRRSSCRSLLKKEVKRKKSFKSLKVLCLDKISLMQTEGAIRDLSNIPYMLFLYPDDIEPKAIRGVRWGY